ncbi:MAG: hypothetical protein K8T91_17085 [Planctomycetes bacterium]|nr:hypothetical protein [Planctomycetota bacterium]
MVTITKHRVPDGYFYEIPDLEAYAQALMSAQGVEVPPARYRVFVSHENVDAIRQTDDDWERQIALFFRLGPDLGIDYQIVPDGAEQAST